MDCGSLQSSNGGGDDELDAACGGSSSLIYGLQDLGTPPLSSHWCSTTTAPLVPPAGAGAASASSPPPCHGGLASSAPAAAATAAASQPATAPTRGSRKRPRASRRAPTTVLTTDTSNFRAMVQEFTGIPAPPFAGGAPRSRFDHHLFPSRSSSSPAAAAAAATALPQYLLPFAHKLHAYPPPSMSPPAPANAVIATSTGTTAAAAGDSYQQHLTTTSPSALLGMQDHSGVNSYLSVQSTHLAGGDAKYPLFDDDSRVAASSAAPRMQNPTGFIGVAQGVVMSSEGTHAHHLHPRNGGRGDELLSGLGGGCKATYSSAPPPLERNGRSQPAGASTATTTRTTVAATAAMRPQGVESWVCSTSE